VLRRLRTTVISKAAPSRPLLPSTPPTTKPSNEQPGGTRATWPAARTAYKPRLEPFPLPPSSHAYFILLLCIASAILKPVPTFHLSALSIAVQPLTGVARLRGHTLYLSVSLALAQSRPVSLSTTPPPLPPTFSHPRLCSRPELSHHELLRKHCVARYQTPAVSV
jgi:hypothetical protein